jgi:hypothetical protein
MRIAGWSSGSSRARLALLPAVAIVIAGCAVWMMLPQKSDAESGAAATAADARVTQGVSRTDGAATTQAVLAIPQEPTVPTDAHRTAATGTTLDIAPLETEPAKSPIDGLRISSQSWRRGGLGSKAMVTFTIRNTNNYSVKDIEIACAFKRQDGSHVTDRRRVIHDTVNKKSRKRYAGMLIGFINVNASKAKCSLVTASRT